jgi:hypothetical protein
VGSSALIGATVNLWAVGTSTVQVGINVTTAADGSFSMNFNCPSASTLMYVAAAGGHVGSQAANAKIAMVSGLGACGSLPSGVVVNELTTAASTYALSGFAAAGATAATFQGKSPGIDQAFLTLTNLINPATGAFTTTGRESNATVIQQRLDTVANALSGCNVSSGASVCAELFSCVQANATYAVSGQPCTGGTGPTANDTTNAALAIAQNAGTVSMAGIFDVANGHHSFAPYLSAAPLEWSLPLVFTVRNYGPLAIDSTGNVWLLAPDPHPANSSAPNLAVTEMDPTGAFLSPHQTGHDWSAGGVASINGNDVTNLAIDLHDNVWVSGSTSVIAKLTSAGAGAAGAPFTAVGRADDTSAVSIDINDNAWIASGAGNDVYEFSNSGTMLTATGGLLTLNCPCDGMAADVLGNVWTISNGTNQFLAQISAGGVEGNIQSPSSGYPLVHYTAVAADADGDLWIADQHYHGVWEAVPAGANATLSAAPFANDAGSGTAPKAVAVDGAGHKWIANNPSVGNFPSVTELSADGTANLSPSDGFGFQVNSSVTTAYAIAVDGSGNVWVTDGSGTITEFVGAASPTRNPIVSGLAAGSFVP